MSGATCAFCLMLSHLPEHVSMGEAPAVAHDDAARILAQALKKQHPNRRGLS